MGIEILIYADERGELPSKLKVRHLYDTYLLADEVLNSNSSLDFGMSEKLVLLFGVT